MLLLMLHLTCACTLHVVKKAITLQAHHAVTSSDRLGTAALPTKLFLVSGLDGRWAQHQMYEAVFA